MMLNETEVVNQFASAQTPQQLASILRNPTPAEARALIAYLGEQRFHRLRTLSFDIEDQRNLNGSSPDRNVVFLPGIMGSELAITESTKTYPLWLNVARIAFKGLEALRLDPEGVRPVDPRIMISAVRPLPKYYGETLLTLGRSWNVRAFAYDWRADLSTQASALLHFILREFGGAPVSIVAHSMGGLVSRSLWKINPSTEAGKPLLNRLIMLGTPNFGSYEIPLIFAGIQESVKKLAWLTQPGTSIFNQEEGRKRLLSVLLTFPGIYQMLPRKGLGADILKNPSFYREANIEVSAAHLQRGVAFLDGLQSAVDPSRMSYIAGDGIETIVGVDTKLPLNRLDSYWATRAGDGKVPHDLGLLQGVPTYFVPVAHGDLPVSIDVLQAVDQLLRSQTPSLPKKPQTTRDGSDEPYHPQIDSRQSEVEFGNVLDNWAASSITIRGEVTHRIDPDESQIQDEVMSGFVPTCKTGANLAVEADNRIRGDLAPLRIQVRLVHGNIATCHLNDMSAPPIDVVSLGIYENQRRSWSAIRAIDESILGKTPTEEHPGPLDDLITRGMIRGQLAVPTLIPDPRRDPRGEEGGRSVPANRHIAFVGMGVAGQFGPPESRQASRELAWMLGRLGKKHLATILIGSGNGNLSIETTVQEILIGLSQALNDARRDDNLPDRLQIVTLIEYNALRLQQIDVALRNVIPEVGRKYLIDIQYTGLAPEEILKLQLEAVEKRYQRDVKHLQQGGGPVHIDLLPPANRVSVEQIQDSFWFSAMTENASIPQRQVEIDSRIVVKRNSLLLAATNEQDQLKSGRILGRLLLPRDFRELFHSGTPVVMDVDNNTARIHWELAVHDFRNRQDQSPQHGDSEDNPGFLGLERGFTRQLRTRFAPAPERQPARGRILKALVVADPAADATLPGAQREGMEVVEIFNAFNRLNRGRERIECVQLIGPGVATREQVLGELLEGNYDFVHFAGHCFFNEASPMQCGWLFRKGDSLADREVLSAREIRRIDRVPPFIFSNACESGVLPFRPEESSPMASPAFAETFFERGVNNFICTGWPVNDGAARIFSRVFYGSMLGLQFNDESPGIELLHSIRPKMMFEAMMEARKRVRTYRGGLRTWGAYMHYGNPYTRFILPPAPIGEEDGSVTSPPTGGPVVSSPSGRPSHVQGAILPPSSLTGGGHAPSVKSSSPPSGGGPIRPPASLLKGS